MSEPQRAVVGSHEFSEGNLRTYVAGFGLSIVLTISAYLLVVHHSLNRRALIAVIIVLALVQFLVQMMFFLRLGNENKPRCKLLVFLFMITVVGILVFGSLWIMNNLNYRMTPSQINNYVSNQSQDGL